MELHGQNLIAGKMSALGGSTFEAMSPQRSERLLPLFREATLDEIDQACNSADAAFPQLRAARPLQIAALLDDIAERILALGDALIERASAETGLPPERLSGERGRTVGQLRMFANVAREGSWRDARIDHAIEDRKPLRKPDLRRILIPVGPVAVWAASNFPLAFSVAGGDTASALAAGNPVVVKAHPGHPGTSELVARAISESVKSLGFPAGVFSMLHGTSPEVSQALVGHPAIRAGAFTGSLRAGRALYNAAAARPEPIPFFAEMGSVNPVLVLPRALAERSTALAQGLAQSVNLGVGQFCTCPGLVFGVEGGAFEDFAGKLRSAFHHAAPGTLLYAGILQAYQHSTARIRELPSVHATCSESAPDTAKNQARPELFEASAPALRQYDELLHEVFGPSTVLIRCQSRDEMERLVERLEGSLTATVHGTPDDLAEYHSVISLLETKVGRLVFNGFPTGVEVCPSMQHGGPYPATTDSRFTSVGTAAIQRFARPICYQDLPPQFLPPELQDANPGRIWRTVDGEWKQG